MLQAKTLKRDIIILVSTLIISLVLLLVPRGLDSVYFDLVPAIYVLFLILPFVSGILLVLIQDKSRSYDFLPNLLLGSVWNNAVIVLVLSLTEYFRHGYAYRQFFDFYDLIGFFLPLVAISVFGGLIGLVIRGTTEQCKKYPDAKITIAFRKILGSVFIGLGALGGAFFFVCLFGFVF
jgi:hypothetical protein